MSVFLDEPNGINGWYIEGKDSYIHLSCTDDNIEGPSTPFYKWGYETEYSNTTNSSLDLIINYSGLTSLSYYCVDAVGNYEGTPEEPLSLADNIGYDAQPPQTKIDIVKGEKIISNTYKSDIILNLTCQDDSSFCKEEDSSDQIYYSIDEEDYKLLEENKTITISGQGSHNLKYYSVDLAGHEEEEEKINFYIDYNNAPITIVPDGILSSSGENFNLTAFLLPSLSLFQIAWEFEDNTTIFSLDGQTINKSFTDKGKHKIIAFITDGDMTVVKEVFIYIGKKPFFPNGISTLELDFKDIPDGIYTLDVKGGNSSNFSIGTLLNLFQYYEITSNLANGDFKVDLTFYYNDSDNDGLIDGTQILEDSLNIYYYVNNSWVLIQNPSINKNKNTISITVNHFTLFSVFGTQLFVSNPPGNGGGGGGWGSSGWGRLGDVANISNSSNNSFNLNIPVQTTPLKEGFFRRLFKNFFSRGITGAAVSKDMGLDGNPIISLLATILVFGGLFYIIIRYKARSIKEDDYLIKPIVNQNFVT
jgi:hypothetical protein